MILKKLKVIKLIRLADQIKKELIYTASRILPNGLNVVESNPPSSVLWELEMAAFSTCKTIEYIIWG